MADGHRVDLFCEDAGHEELGKPLIKRCAQVEDVEIHVQTRNATGGAARVLQELQAYQEACRVGSEGLGVPAVLAVLIDANGRAWNQRRDEVEDVIDDGVFPFAVIGCPEPEVETWYMADENAFHTVVGVPPQDGGDGAIADPKHRLARSVEEGQGIVVRGGIEVGPDVAREMDLYRAGQNNRSLRAFTDGLRNALRRVDDV